MSAFQIAYNYNNGYAPAEFLLWMLCVIAVGIWVGIKEDT
jgi:hypothetical protein